MVRFLRIGREEGCGFVVGETGDVGRVYLQHSKKQWDKIFGGTADGTVQDQETRGGEAAHRDKVGRLLRES